MSAPAPAAVAAPSAPPASPGALLDAAHRRATLGVVLVVSVMALEAMAVATVLPVTVRDLGGLALYGWAFTGFFIANVVALVDAGSRADRTGPRTPFVGGLLVFAAGLLVAGLATSMPVLVLARALQGFGSGWVVVAIYVVVGRAYAEALRPAVFSALSAAWVAPALVGPAAAGAAASVVGWRWVFLGMVPVVLVGAALLAPVLRTAHGRSAEGADGAPRAARTGAAVLVATGLALVQAAGHEPTRWSVLPLVAGLVLLLPALGRLLPRGTGRLRPGLPATVGYRGILSGAFFTAEAFLPLSLVEAHGLDPARAGLPLTAGAIGWSVAAWWQGRRPAGSRRAPLVRGGLVLVGAGVAGLALLTTPLVPLGLAIAAWAVTGAGMGLAHSTLSVLTLKHSPRSEQGRSSAAVQVSDVVGTVVGISAAGTLLSLATAATGGAATGAAIALVDLAVAGAALVAALGARRVEPRS